MQVELKPRRLPTTSLDEGNLRALLADWQVFVVNNIFAGDKVRYTFHDAVEKFFWEGEPDQTSPSIRACLEEIGAPHLWHALPRPYSKEPPPLAERMALFLPRGPRADRAADVFRRAGAFDLGAYLAVLCKRQHAHRHPPRVDSAVENGYADHA